MSIYQGNILLTGSTEDNSVVIPEVNSSDNGKFLRVVDGIPAWSTIPSAEEASF